MGKGEIARNKQFLLFPQCFLLNHLIESPPYVHIFDIISLFAAELEEPKIGIPGKGLKGKGGQYIRLFSQGFTLYHTILTFNYLKMEPFGKHCGKRRKCWLSAFSPFPTMFCILPKSNFNFSATFDLFVCMCFQFGPV